MARRHNNIRWDNRYKVGKPNDGGRNKEGKVAQSGKGCFFVPAGDYRVVYHTIVAFNRTNGFSGANTLREHPSIGENVPDSQIEFNGLVKALGEELAILGAGIKRLTKARDTYKGEYNTTQRILEDIAQKYPIVGEEISQARL